MAEVHEGLLRVLHAREQLAELPGAPGYYVGVTGRVFGARRWHPPVGQKPCPAAPRFLRPSRHPRTGHLRVGVYREDGSRWTLGVHQAVALAFLGPVPPTRPEVCHANGDPTDNRLSNLRYDTTSANQRDRWIPPVEREQLRLMDREARRELAEELAALGDGVESAGMTYEPDPDFGF